MPKADLVAMQAAILTVVRVASLALTILYPIAYPGQAVRPRRRPARATYVAKRLWVEGGVCRSGRESWSKEGR